MINSQKPSAVFFDFDGVLCTDYFYTTLEQDYPEVRRYINANIFGGPGKYPERWMRAELTYRDINKIISDATGITFERLTGLFKESVRLMRINPTLIQFALELKRAGIKTALVTGNMDIFNEITVPEKKLAEVFPVIINSFDYRMMKRDENGKLFDIALKKLGLDSYQGTWIIDDSPDICALFTAKGGRAHRFSGMREFELWLEQIFYPSLT
jgi:FMN phosphatase YigB (HAD superfamily)